jgi:restriction system protein
VKALWSDVLEEKAAGLVVTTARLSPGAAAVCQARGYSIMQANMEHLRAWLGLMRTPGTGIFLGE